MADGYWLLVVIATSGSLTPNIVGCISARYTLKLPELSSRTRSAISS